MLTNRGPQDSIESLTAIISTTAVSMMDIPLAFSGKGTVGSTSHALTH